MQAKLKNSSISILPFKKALKSLSDVLREPFSALIRDAAIQRFEYTFELSWKLMKRYFKVNNNLDIFNVKNIFREAGKQQLIENVETWFDFLEARNLTSHTYDEKIADKVYQKSKEFEAEARLFLKRLTGLLK